MRLDTVTAPSAASAATDIMRPTGRLALFPNTLLWQTFVLICLLLVLALATWSQIFRHLQEPTRARDLAQMVSSVVNLTRTALINAEPARRTDLLIDLVALEGIRIYPAEPDDRIEALADTRPMRLLTAEIRAQLGDHTQFASRWKALDGFWVSFRLHPEDEDEFWVMLQPDRFAPRGGLDEILMWTAGVLSVALIGAFFIVSWISKPMRQLARSARMVGHGETPPNLPEDGPLEIAAVARAFNQMAGDLARTDADRALLLAGVSHDLRTPLARLRLGVELSGASAPDILAMVTDIEEMDRIIGQFLDYGRGAPTEPMNRVELGTFLGELVEAFRARGAQIRFDRPQQGIEADIHALPLRRAVANLIDNALRHAGNHTALDVSLLREGDHACLRVADRGPGIPSAEIERLRQPFTRLEPARSGTRGAGLGLAIIDRIMSAQGGTLELLPREGGGLCACIRIPCAQAQPRQARIQPSAEAAAS